MRVRFPYNQYTVAIFLQLPHTNIKWLVGAGLVYLHSMLLRKGHVSNESGTLVSWILRSEGGF
jgi:hypothetical protein